MDPVLVVLLALLPAYIAAGAVIWRQIGVRWGDLRPGDSVIVCTCRPDDQSVQGVVTRSRRAGISLEGAHLLAPDGSATALAPGSVWMRGANVSFVQRHVDAIPVLPPAGAERPPRPALPDLERPARLRDAAGG